MSNLIVRNELPNDRQIHVNVIIYKHTHTRTQMYYYYNNFYDNYYNFHNNYYKDDYDKNKKVKKNPQLDTVLLKRVTL